MAHEIGHALGLFHEHQRPDRGNFIKVITSNLMAGSEADFNTVEGTIQTELVQYDLASVMQYDSFVGNISYEDRLFNAKTNKRKAKLFTGLILANTSSGLNENFMKLTILL